MTKLEQRYGHWGPVLFPEVWELLKKYTFVINERLREQGLPPTSQIKVMGGICSHFLLAIRSGILDDYNDARLRQKLNYARKRIGTRPDLPTGAATTDLSRISYLPRLSEAARAEFVGDGEPPSFGPLRWNSRGPDPLDRGLPEVPRQVRGRMPRASTTLGVWGRISKSLEPKRQTFAQSGYTRLPPKTSAQEDSSTEA
jgi:hypothetical protein